jgi:hypothetical protein
LTANELDIDNLEDANMFKSVSFASATGIITFTLYDDTTTSINLPTELIVSGGSYDPTTKDLTLVLASGDEIVIPLDDILTGVATETYVQTQLESYYTKIESNSAFLEAGTTKTSELINDGDGTSNFITASQLGDAGYGDMTEAEYATNGAVGVVDKAVVAESLETSDINDLPYIGDGQFTIPKNGVVTAIKNDNLVQPDVEGLTFSQIANGDLPTDIAEWTAFQSLNTSGDGYLINTGTGAGTTAISFIDILTTGVAYVYKVKFRVTNSDCLFLRVNDGVNSISIANPTINEWYTEYVVSTASTFRLQINHTYADTTTATGKVMQIDYVMAIPVPTKIASYPDAQILKFFSGADYIPYGVHGIKDLVITSHYTDIQGDAQTQVYELDTAMYSHDTREYQGDKVEEGVAVGATINATLLPLIKASSTFYAVDETTGETQEGTVGDVLTLTNTAKVIYELATYLPRTEANDNLLVERGQLLVSQYGSYTQDSEYGVKTEFSAESALDLVKQVQLGVETDVVQEKKLIEIDDKIEAFNVSQEEDLRFPATLIRQGATTKPDFDTTDVVLLFPQNDATEIAYINAQMPHAWEAGTSIEPHIHYIQEASGQAVFKIDYRWFNIGDAVPSTWTTYTMDTDAITYVSGDLHQLVIGALPISGTGFTASSVLQIKLYRDDNVYVGDAKVIEFDIHYKVNKFGLDI